MIFDATQAMHLDEVGVDMLNADIKLGIERLYTARFSREQTATHDIANVDDLRKATFYNASGL